MIKRLGDGRYTVRRFTKQVCPRCGHKQIVEFIEYGKTKKKLWKVMSVFAACQYPITADVIDRCWYHVSDTKRVGSGRFGPKSLVCRIEGCTSTDLYPQRSICVEHYREIERERYRKNRYRYAEANRKKRLAQKYIIEPLSIGG